MALSEQEELEMLRLRKQKAMATAEPAAEAAPEPSKPKVRQVPAGTMAGVLANAAWGGAAAIPDTIMNAPNRLFNLAKTGMAALQPTGNAFMPVQLNPNPPDVALRPDPDPTRKLLESLGLMKPGIEPEGPLQKTADVLTRGAVSGALTGGASIPGAVTGAGMGMLSSGASAATEELTGSPSLGIAAGLMAPRGVSLMLGGRSNVSPEVRKLADEGVSMTPGQIAGGTLKRVEDAATSYPLLGDLIKARQREGHETFDRAAINRSLAPIGEKLPPRLKGSEAVAYAQDKLGARYDELLAKVTPSLDAPAGAAPKTPTLRGDLGVILGQARSKLSASTMADLDDIVQTEVVDIFKQGGGTLPGAGVKDIESKLSGLSADLRRSTDYQDRRLAVQIREVKDAVHESIARADPKIAAELSQADAGWANFKRVQNAAGRVGSREGVFTPNALQSAVRAGDKSKDKSKFARQEALMQDLAGAGQKVLTPSVPDSGTPLRTEVIKALQNPQRLVPGVVAAGAYSSPVQNLVQKVMLGKQGQLMDEATFRSLIPLAATAVEAKRLSTDAHPEVAAVLGAEAKRAEEALTGAVSAASLEKAANETEDATLKAALLKRAQEIREKASGAQPAK